MDTKASNHETAALNDKVADFTPGSNDCRRGMRAFSRVFNHPSRSRLPPVSWASRHRLSKGYRNIPECSGSLALDKEYSELSNILFYIRKNSVAFKMGTKMGTLLLCLEKMRNPWGGVPWLGRVLATRFYRGSILSAIWRARSRPSLSRSTAIRNKQRPALDFSHWCPTCTFSRLSSLVL